MSVGSKIDGFIDRVGDAYERSLHPEATGRKKVRQDRRHARFILQIGWVLIILKSLGTVWAFDHFRVSWSPLWIIAPDVLFALIASLVWYYWEDWFGRNRDKSVNSTPPL